MYTTCLHWPYVPKSKSATRRQVGSWSEQVSSPWHHQMSLTGRRGVPGSMSRGFGGPCIVGNGHMGMGTPWTAWLADRYDWKHYLPIISLAGGNNPQLKDGATSERSPTRTQKTCTDWLRSRKSIVYSVHRGGGVSTPLHARIHTHWADTSQAASGMHPSGMHTC